MNFLRTHTTGPYFPIDVEASENGDVDATPQYYIVIKSSLTSNVLNKKHCSRTEMLAQVLYGLDICILLYKLEIP